MPIVGDVDTQAHVHRQASSYTQHELLREMDTACVTLDTEAMPWLAGNDLEWVRGRALCHFIGWKLQELQA